MSVSDITNKLIKNGIDAVRTIDEENTVLKARIAKLEDALKLGLEYWAHRQQRYKNRSPIWVERAREVLK
jgi:hypothetical protein